MRGVERDAQDEAVTRGAKTVRILAVVAVLTVSAAFAAYAMELHRMVLWQVVRACVADYKLTRAPFPCLEVDLSGGEEGGTVVLRPPLSEDTILAPTRRIKGIEDPFLQSPEAPNYFDAAWRARTFLKGAGRSGAGARRHRAVRELRDCQNSGPAPHPRGLPRSLTRAARSRPMRRRSRWANGRRSGRSSPTRCSGPIASRERSLRTSIRFGSPPRSSAARRMARATSTVVVVGARVEGDDQFLILASYAKAPHAWWPVGADNLLGDCR